jgi:hypothetical protein
LVDRGAGAAAGSGMAAPATGAVGWKGTEVTTVLGRSMRASLRASALWPWSRLARLRVPTTNSGMTMVMVSFPQRSSRSSRNDSTGATRSRNRELTISSGTSKPKRFHSSCIRWASSASVATKRAMRWSGRMERA